MYEEITREGYEEITQRRIAFLEDELETLQANERETEAEIIEKENKLAKLRDEVIEIREKNAKIQSEIEDFENEINYLYRILDGDFG